MSCCDACVYMQGELVEKDSELFTVKSDREKLEKEMQSMLQKEQEDSKAKGKGPGGMLHSALQQLQRELRREAVANEKLMVKAESLLKDGSKPAGGKSSSEPALAAKASDAEQNKATSDLDKQAKDAKYKQVKEDEEPEDEADKETTAAEETVRCVAGSLIHALPIELCILLCAYGGAFPLQSRHLCVAATQCFPNIACQLSWVTACC